MKNRGEGARSHMWLWARCLKSYTGNVGQSARSPHKFSGFTNNNKDNLLKNAFFSNVLQPKPPKSCVYINTNSRPAARHAPHAEHREGSCTETPLHFTGPPQFTSGGVPATTCILHAPAVCSASPGGTCLLENQETVPRSFILKILGSKLKSAARNVMWETDTRVPAV